MAYEWAEGQAIEREGNVSQFGFGLMHEAWIPLVHFITMCTFVEL